MELAGVMITGVSTGIGAASARLLSNSGFHVFGSVRKLEDSNKLQQELGDRFTRLVFDLRDKAAILEAASVVRTALQGNRLAGLVNNAAMAIGGPLALQPLNEIAEEFEVNVVGTIAVTQASIYPLAWIR
jgi:NADP-dependent 3-hydroxy acid dehydrogenase YdfG